jgi:hypothetical protein
MAYKVIVNYFTGELQLINESEEFNPDTILTGPTECVFTGPTAPLEVLIDQNGNVLIGVIS